MCEFCELKCKINEIYCCSGLRDKGLDNALSYMYCECEIFEKENKKCLNSYCMNCENENCGY